MLTLLQADSAELLIQEAAAPEKMSLIKMAVAGGWLMIVLLILSIIAIYILGSRWWAIRQAGKLDPHFMANIRELVRAGKTSSAISLCSLSGPERPPRPSASAVRTPRLSPASSRKDSSARAIPCPTSRPQSRTWPTSR